jgi:hypothetical protein
MQLRGDALGGAEHDVARARMTAHSRRGQRCEQYDHRTRHYRCKSPNDHVPEPNLSGEHFSGIFPINMQGICEVCENK